MILNTFLTEEIKDPRNLFALLTNVLNSKVFGTSILKLRFISYTFVKFADLLLDYYSISNQ